LSPQYRAGWREAHAGSRRVRRLIIFLGNGDLLGVPTVWLMVLLYAVAMS
jgi:hypothetical protein